MRVTSARSLVVRLTFSLFLPPDTGSFLVTQGVKRAESHPQPDPPFSLHITRLSSPLVTHSFHSVVTNP